MGTGYLMDTSAVIKYFTYAFPMEAIYFMDKAIDAKAIISFITEIELQVWSPSDETDIAIYKEFIGKSVILGISDKIIKKTIDIRKSYRLKVPDAIIAATAIVYDYILLADNDKDFLKVEGLNYLNPARELEANPK